MKSNIELPPTLLEDLRGLILQARHQATRSVNTLQVQTYWQIGRHIVEFEQGGGTRASYGKRLLAALAKALTAEFGKGFDERNLRNMRAFFQNFPNWNAVRSDLSWTHYRLLLRVYAHPRPSWQYYTDNPQKPIAKPCLPQSLNCYPPLLPYPLQINSSLYS